ncbi:CPBP family intramembrane glutamic endopeptidase [Natronorubrum sulfidifaciens]|uniref:CAAX prenyl protease 2/Lysostaphin resistance protein A-like domain-containing protein n=1 Tax=Natronorubrum sulfidifaciens JCM 14089 TaxID=1230460 RepID=L9W1L2_9EURY|nr:CPBP family intramembrane glutamic endopeptidase [Natronorubrum sulfidifaciens]ELY43345.1 hypothetical protein C495_13206 [Natronorubrum sulfidifaciens JCM 14089]
MGTSNQQLEQPRGRHESVSVRALGAFFLLTFAFSWLLWLPKVAIASDIALGGGTMETVLRSVSALPEVGAFGPSVAAFVLVYATHGRAGVSRLVGRALDRSFDRRWLVPMLFLFPLLAAVALGVAVATGFEPSLPWAGQPVALPVAFVWILLLGGPLQEEFGWRGYALEPLQARLGSLGAGLGLGLVWGVWHLPWFYMPSMTMYYNRPIWGFLVTITLLSVVMTWLFDNTGGSLLGMVLVHTTFNWSQWAFPAIDSDTGGLVVIGLMAALVVAIVARHGTQTFASRPRS